MDIPDIAIIKNGLNRSAFCPSLTIFEDPSGMRYTDKYSDADATWVMAASILIFFMKTGFLFIEVAFVSDDHTATRRVVLAKYLDTCASGIAFYLFGYAISGEAGEYVFVLGESQDYITWFFRFTFASNTATILHGTLVGEPRKLRMIALFIYAFLISAFIHPYIARLMWSKVGQFSPYRFCNGTVDRDAGKFVFIDSFPGPSDDIVFFDFAGSGVVHMLGGFGGLVLAIICKHDLKRDQEAQEKAKRDHHAGFQVSPDLTLDTDQRLHGGIRKSSSPATSRHRRDPTNVNRAAASASATVTSPATPSETTRTSAQRVDSSTPLLAVPAVSFASKGAPLEASNYMSMNAIDGIMEPDSESEVEEDFLDEMYPKDASGEHMEFAALGVLILWMTFFAFNCGTVESISGKVNHGILGRIALNMVVAGCFSGTLGIVIALFAQLRSRSKFMNTNEIANCILGSLVSSTGVSPFIQAPRAIVVGIGATAFYHLGGWIEYRGGIRDTARVFPVHGMCGLWGLLCVGLLGEPNLIRVTYENSCECLHIRLPDSIESTGNLIAYQLAAICLIAAWSIGTCCFIFFILRLIPMQAVANIVDVVLVDFLDYYLYPFFKLRRKRYQYRKKRHAEAKRQDREQQLETAGAAAVYAEDISREELFTFKGGMLFTKEDEYGMVTRGRQS